MNYYEILKVTKNASSTQIKTSYKELVKKYHPDLYVGDKDFAEKKIKEINEAYDILSNPETKSEYDKYLASLEQPKIEPTPTGQPRQHTATTNYTQPPPPPQESIFNQFIFKQINKLNKKQQFQLLILVLLMLLGLFLINLIELKNFLSEPKKNLQVNENIITTNNIQTDITSNSIPTNQLNEFNEINNIIYELFQQYENIYNSNSTSIY